MAFTMEDSRWHVLNYIPCGRRVSAETAAGKCDAPLEVFAPTYIEMVRRDDGSWARTERPLLYHYVFVKGCESDVKSLCAGANGFSLIMNRAGDERYLTASESSVSAFRRLAAIYRSSIPCYLSTEIDLESGDLVEIVSGEFAGIRGRYVPKAGGRSGYVTLSVTEGLHALILGVRSDYVRILEFARDSRRIYDQLDAYQPRLYRALRACDHLTARELSAVQIFTRRLGLTAVSDCHLKSRLSLLLWASYRLLGDESSAAEAYKSVAPHNIWQRLLHALICHRLDGTALPAVPAGLQATSSSRRALLQEYTDA